MTLELVKTQAARRAIAEARSVDEVKDIRDKAEAVRLYAKQAGLGLEMVNDAAEIKLRAERKAGELLSVMDKRTGGDAKQDITARNSLPPKLSDLGVSLIQSHRWQQVASVPEDEFENHIASTKSAHRELTTASVIKMGQENKREKSRQAAIERGDDLPTLTDTYRLIWDDVATGMAQLEPASVDVIITDPPYPQEYLPVYEHMAREAVRVLKPGALAVVMCGQSYLPQIYSALGNHLTYHWTAAYLTPGGQAVQLWQRKVNTFWKPLLIYSNGDYTGNWLGDVCKSAVNDNDKQHHDWGQSESGMTEVIEKFSKPGDVVLDPFAGAGTTGVCAIHQGRRFVGIDCDADQIKLSADRLAA